MKKILKGAYDEAKNIPKSAWIAAAIVPGGLIALASFLVSIGIYKQKKEKKDDPSKAD